MDRVLIGSPWTRSKTWVHLLSSPVFKVLVFEVLIFKVLVFEVLNSVQGREAKNYTLSSGTSPYLPYKGVPPPPPRDGRSRR